MKGWAYINQHWVESDDLQHVEVTMTALIKRFGQMDNQLTDTLAASEAEKLAQEFDRLAVYWNANAEFLEHAAQRRRLHDIKAAIRQLKWPVGEPSAVGSS